MLAVLKIHFVFISLLLLSLLLSGNAQAKPEHGKRFKNWTVVCEKLPNSGKEVCNIFQNVSNENQKVVLQIAVGYVPGMDKPQAILTLPLGVLLEPGLEFNGGNAKAIRLPYRVCVANGCIAMTVLNEETIKGMKEGSKGSVKFAVAKEQVVEVPISLSGFTAAFNSLK